MEVFDSGVGFAVCADGVSAVTGGIDDLIRAALAILEFGDLASAGVALDSDAGGDKVADLEEALFAVGVGKVLMVGAAVFG